MYGLAADDPGIPAPANADLCGPDLEYDPDFLALEAALREQPAQEFRDKEGAAILIAGQGIDWEQVRARAETLLERSKDLRLAVCLTRALLHGEGIGGLARGLALIAQWLEQHWDGVHPRLDAEDQSPTMRLNALAALDAADAVLGDLRACALLRSSPDGLLTVADLEAARSQPGTFAGVRRLGEEQLAEWLAQAVRCDGALPGLVRQALDRLQSISDLLLRQLGPELVPDFSRLRDTLQLLLQATESVLPSGGGSGASVTPAAMGASSIEMAAMVERTASVALPVIQGRDDVVEMLEVLCQYLDRFEPGSPVQIMLRRARRMMDMTFLELIQELAPEGLGQIERAIGASLEQKSI